VRRSRSMPLGEQAICRMSQLANHDLSVPASTHAVGDISDVSTV
jgi:hypothetical protein